MPVASAMRTMRSKFEATPAASTIAPAPSASTTEARDGARVSVKGGTKLDQVAEEN